MSSPRPSGSRPPSFPLGPNDIAAQMGQMRIGVTPPRVSMPEPRVWTPPAAPQDEKPLPPVPQGPPLPPRVRPNHVVDRPNPYDFMPPIPIPPPMMMPAPTHYEDERPVYISHSRSDPPPAIRPSPVPPISVTPPGTAFQQHAPHNRPRISLPPQRYSSPPSPTLDTLAPPQASAGRVRASSVPPSPSTSRAYDGGVQCSGTTKTGKRCTRVVKAPHPYTQATPAKDGDIERFCHQHISSLLEQSGIYSPNKRNAWIEFDDWIPSYLSPDTRAALRAEMSSSPSAADVSGYIYCYEIRDQKTPNQVHLKVGRAVNMVKRLDEWSKQCGSKEVVLRGWWPGKVVDNDGVGPSLLKGRVQAGEKGKYCHRLERLIHLELSDLVVNEAYLSTDFTNPSKSARAMSPTPSTAKSTGTPPKKLVKKKCADCGAMHKEIFSFTRIPKGKLKGREWDGVVQPVIERWGKFVEDFM